jgi:hypothetical protein
MMPESSPRFKTGPLRFEIALDMSLFARELAATRLRMEHPGRSEWEVRRELLRYAFQPGPMPQILR